MNKVTRTIDLLVAVLAETDPVKRQDAVDELKILSAIEEIMSQKVDSLETLLKVLGVPCSSLGYDYIFDAVDILVSEPDAKNQVVSHVYRKIAERHNTTGASVERAIRHAIECAFNNGDLSIFQKYFGSSVNSRTGKPNNSEFLCRCALEVRKMGGVK